MSNEAKIAWLKATSIRLMEIASELNTMGYYNFSDEIDEERFEIHKQIRRLEDANTNQN